MTKKIAERMFKRDKMPDIKKFERMLYNGQKVVSLRTNQWEEFKEALYNAGVINERQKNWTPPSVCTRDVNLSNI